MMKHLPILGLLAVGGFVLYELVRPKPKKENGDYVVAGAKFTYKMEDILPPDMPLTIVPGAGGRNLIVTDYSEMPPT